MAQIVGPRRMLWRPWRAFVVAERSHARLRREAHKEGKLEVLEFVVAEALEGEVVQRQAGGVHGRARHREAASEVQRRELRASDGGEIGRAHV